MRPSRRTSLTRPMHPQQQSDAASDAAMATLLAPRRTIVQDLPADRIQPNPFHQRRTFSDIDRLARVILAHGFTTRLRVRPHPTQPDFFQLVFGERRLRAAQLAGMAIVPCEIADHTDEELMEIGLAENLQRCDLTPLEAAQAFALLIRERGYSVRRLAERIGKDKSYIEDRLALLRAPTDVQQMVEQRPDTLRIAREIATLASPSARASLIAGVLAGDLSTQNVREIVKVMRMGAPASPPLVPAALGGVTGERKRFLDASDGADSEPSAASGAGASCNHAYPSHADHRAPSPTCPWDPGIAQTLGVIARDTRTMTAILDRWRHLTSHNAAVRAALAESLDAIIRQVQQLSAHLGQASIEVDA